MIVIVEGPDGAGKTSLIERYWSTSRVHNGPPDGEPLFSRFSRQLDNAETALVEDPERLIVFDRFHISEQVYGPLVRGYNGLGLIGFETLDERLVALGAQLIFCDPGLDTVMRNWWRNRPAEMIQSASVMRNVYMAYKNAISTSALPMRMYDYRSDFSNPLLR